MSGPGTPATGRPSKATKTSQKIETLSAVEFVQIAVYLQAKQRRTASAAPTSYRFRAVVGGL